LFIWFIKSETKEKRIKIMAKAKAATSAIKITFGTRRNGKAKKAYSKSLNKPKKYRGQGR
jgi:hypothetical protein